MLLSRMATIVPLPFFTLLSLHNPSSVSAQGSVGRFGETTPWQDTRPANCRVTLPADGVYEPPSTVSPPSRTPDRFFFGNAGLWTVLPGDGILRGPGPEKPGDFAYHGRSLWFRTHAPFLEQDGPASLEGKRLDGPGPSFIAFYDGTSYPVEGGIAVAVMVMDVSVFGCWELTGHYKDQDVTFTIWVTSLTEEEESLEAQARALRSRPVKAARRVHIDPEVQAKSLVYKVLPEAPPATDATNASGTVVLHAVIGTDGRPHELSYVSGPQALVKAAIDSVTWWQYKINVARFDPYEAQEVDTTISISFPP